MLNTVDFCSDAEWNGSSEVERDRLTDELKRIIMVEVRDQEVAEGDGDDHERSFQLSLTVP